MISGIEKGEVSARAGDTMPGPHRLGVDNESAEGRVDDGLAGHG